MYLPYLYNTEYFHYPKYLVCFTCLSQSPPYLQLTTTDLFTVSVVSYFSRMSHTCVCVSCSAAAAKSLQSCPTLCDPTDGSLPGSSVPGILQARTLEWVAISFSCIQLFAILWTVAHQGPLSVEFSRQDHWSGLPFPPPGDLPDPGTELASPRTSALAGRFFTTGATSLMLFPDISCF